MRSFYSIWGDAWILFKYIGESKFTITIENANGKKKKKNPNMPINTKRDKLETPHQPPLHLSLLLKVNW